MTLLNHPDSLLEAFIIAQEWIKGFRAIRLGIGRDPFEGGPLFAQAKKLAVGQRTGLSVTTKRGYVYRSW
jgi:hypothetical protein